MFLRRHYIGLRTKKKYGNFLRVSASLSDTTVALVTDRLNSISTFNRDIYFQWEPPPFAPPYDDDPINFAPCRQLKFPGGPRADPAKIPGLSELQQERAGPLPARLGQELPQRPQLPTQTSLKSQPQAS